MLTYLCPYCGDVARQEGLPGNDQTLDECCQECRKYNDSLMACIVCALMAALLLCGKMIFAGVALLLG